MLAAERRSAGGGPPKAGWEAGRKESSGLRRTGPRNPDRRSRNRPRPAGSTPDRCRRRTPALPGTRSPAAGNRKARRSRVRTALPAVRPSRRAGRSLVLIRTGPDCSWPHPNGDAALMAIHRHLEPANRSSYTGSLPCLSYSRSMISSIIATTETLCYLLEQFARQRAVICRHTLLPGWPRHDAFRALRQVALRAFAEGNGYITLSDMGSHGQKTGTPGAHTGQCAQAVRGSRPGAADGAKRAFRPLTARSVGVR